MSELDVSNAPITSQQKEKALVYSTVRRAAFSLSALLLVAILSGCSPQASEATAGNLLEEYAKSLDGVSAVDEERWFAYQLDPGNYYIATVTVDPASSLEVVEHVAQRLRTWADGNPAGRRTFYHLSLRFGDVVVDIPRTASSTRDRLATADLAQSLPGAERVMIRGWTDYRSAGSDDNGQFLYISILSDGTRPPSSFVEPLMPAIALGYGSTITVDNDNIFDLRNPTEDAGGDRELRIAAAPGGVDDALACVDVIDKHPDVERYRADVTLEAEATTSVVIKSPSDEAAVEAAIRALPCFAALPHVTFTTAQ
jgi:hypothetical protein